MNKILQFLKRLTGKATEDSVIASANQEVLTGNSLTKDAWKRLKKNKMAFGSLIVVTIYAFISFSAVILPIYSYREQVIEHQNLPPSLRSAGELMVEKEELFIRARMKKQGKSEMSASDVQYLQEMRESLLTERRKMEGGAEVLIHNRVYILGTDDLGRDMLARIIYGGQVSIAIGLLGALISVFVGMVIGSIAGYVGGSLDFLIMRFVDILYGLPYMLIVIILMAFFGNNIINLFVALSLLSWLTTARVVRGQVISLKNSPFVEAALSIGSSTSRIIFRHLIPNTLGVMIVFATLRVPSFIMMESFLSFLGLGISAPYASWGSLVKDGVGSMSLYPWRLFGPATAMTLFLFAMNFLGDGLRDAFDPQSKNSL